MKTNFINTGILFLLILFFTSGYSSAQGEVIITTTVKNYFTTAFDCHCPSGGKGEGFSVNIVEASKRWNDDQIDEFSRLVNQFEKLNGVHISPGVRTDDQKKTNPNINSKSTGPNEGPGAALCDWLRQNK